MDSFQHKTLPLGGFQRQPANIVSTYPVPISNIGAVDFRVAVNGTQQYSTMPFPATGLISPHTTAFSPQPQFPAGQVVHLRPSRTVSPSRFVKLIQNSPNPQHAAHESTKAWMARADGAHAGDFRGEKQDLQRAVIHRQWRRSPSPPQVGFQTQRYPKNGENREDSNNEANRFGNGIKNDDLAPSSMQLEHSNRIAAFPNLPPHFNVPPNQQLGTPNGREQFIEVVSSSGRHHGADRTNNVAKQDDPPRFFATHNAWISDGELPRRSSGSDGRRRPITSPHRGVTAGPNDPIIRPAALPHMDNRSIDTVQSVHVPGGPPPTRAPTPPGGTSRRASLSPTLRPISDALHTLPSTPLPEVSNIIGPQVVDGGVLHTNPVTAPIVAHVNEPDDLDSQCSNGSQNEVDIEAYRRRLEDQIRQRRELRVNLMAEHATIQQEFRTVSIQAQTLEAELIRLAEADGDLYNEGQEMDILEKNGAARDFLTRRRVGIAERQKEITQRGKEALDLHVWVANRLTQLDTKGTALLQQSSNQALSIRVAQEQLVQINKSTDILDKKDSAALQRDQDTNDHTVLEQEREANYETSINTSMGVNDSNSEQQELVATKNPGKSFRPPPPTTTPPILSSSEMERQRAVGMAQDRNDPIDEADTSTQAAVAILPDINLSEWSMHSGRTLSEGHYNDGTNAQKPGWSTYGGASSSPPLPWPATAQLSAVFSTSRKSPPRTVPVTPSSNPLQRSTVAGSIFSSSGDPLGTLGPFHLPEIDHLLLSSASRTASPQKGFRNNTDGNVESPNPTNIRDRSPRTGATEWFSQSTPAAQHGFMSPSPNRHHFRTTETELEALQQRQLMLQQQQQLQAQQVQLQQQQMLQQQQQQHMSSIIASPSPYSSPVTALRPRLSPRSMVPKDIIRHTDEGLAAATAASQAASAAHAAAQSPDAINPYVLTDNFKPGEGTPPLRPGELPSIPAHMQPVKPVQQRGKQTWKQRLFSCLLCGDLCNPEFTTDENVVPGTTSKAGVTAAWRQEEACVSPTLTYENKDHSATSASKVSPNMVAAPDAISPATATAVGTAQATPPEQPATNTKSPIPNIATLVIPPASSPQQITQTVSAMTVEPSSVQSPLSQPKQSATITQRVTPPPSSQKDNVRPMVPLAALVNVDRDAAQQGSLSGRTVGALGIERAAVPLLPTSTTVSAGFPTNVVDDVDMAFEWPPKREEARVRSHMSPFPTVLPVGAMVPVTPMVYDDVVAHGSVMDSKGMIDTSGLSQGAMNTLERWSKKADRTLSDSNR